MKTIRRARRWITIALLSVGVSVALAASVSLALERSDQARRFTRALEFDYVTWTAEALARKFGQFGLAASGYLSENDRNGAVLEYLDLVEEAGRLHGEVERTLSDPSHADPQAAAGPVAEKLEQVRLQLEDLQPVAETVLQENVATVLDDLGLGVAGSPFPPVAFQFSQLPMALIVSPRDVILQEASLHLEPGLTLDDQIALESNVETELDVSALVVGIGGLSTYPTMVMESTAIDWLTETIVHEWVHHYLVFRPLGLQYDRSPEARAINETVAGIVGREIGREVLARNYPGNLPPAPETITSEVPPVEPSEPPAFDFRAEMHETRVTVDELLAEGRVEEAEAYMKQRRQFFWDHGFQHIRRLNQAYFAFHGAYADAPGGAAGEDPVGEAVRQVWDLTGDPVEFLQKMARVTTLEDVQALLQE